MSETSGFRGRAALDAGRRVAFFGGSFDPPHNGHLAVARAARTALALDRVLFAPVGTQPLKMQNGARGARASFEDRLAMTRLALAGESGFEVSLVDAPRSVGAPNLSPNYSPNYSLDTLERLRTELGRELDGDGRLFFLMGADSFFGLRQWHRAAEIPFAATLVVASRPGEPVDDLAAALPEGLTLEPWTEGDGVRGGVAVRGFRVRNERGQSAELYLLPELAVEISASKIREAGIRDDEADAAFAAEHATLPEAVAEYIQAHGLYR